MENTIPRTSLSIGLLVDYLLTSSEVIQSLGVTNVWPVRADNKTAKLPYIIYGRMASQQAAVKNVMGADLITLSVSCCARKYHESIDLGEAVRMALEGNDHKVELPEGTVYAKMILLGDAEEFYDDDLDCYCQRLQFTCKAWGTGQR